MFQEITTAYNVARKSGKRPVVLALVTLLSGDQHLYAANTEAPETLGLSQGIDFFDGSRNVGGGGTFGSKPIVSWRACVSQFGSLTRGVTASVRDLPASLSQAEIGAYSITFDNHDGYFSTLLNTASLITGTLELKQGFAGLAWEDMVSLLRAEIVEEALSQGKLRLLTEAIS